MSGEKNQLQSNAEDETDLARSAEGPQKICVKKTLGELIIEGRKKMRMTAKQLAELVAISPSYISKIENDDQVPAKNLIEAIAMRLQLNLKTVLRIHKTRHDQQIELQRNLRATRVLKHGGIPVPETKEYQLGQEIMSNHDLKIGVENLRALTTDPSLFSVALALLRELELSSRINKTTK